MFISVHMTTFCQAQSGWLDRSIRSVLEQSHSELELILYDDGSYDGTAEVLERYRLSDPRVRVITGERNVNSVAKSLGRCFLERSPRAEAITWMFDDNILSPDAIERLATAMATHSADVVYGQTRIHHEEGKHWDIGASTPEQIAKSFETSSAQVPNAGILIRTSVFSRSGWYDANIVLRRSCDWDLFRRIWKTAGTIVRVEHICAEEFGELSQSSLRNSFDTTFGLMAKYVALRDEQAIRLDPLAVVYGPADVIPHGHWTQEELEYIYRVFVRYFVSIGDVKQGARWAHVVLEGNGREDLIVRNLKQGLKDQPDVLDAVLAGMFTPRMANAPALVVDSHQPFVRRVDAFFKRRVRDAAGLERRAWRLVQRTVQFAWRLRPRMPR